MLLIKCITAHLVLNELMEKEMDYKSAHSIMMLVRALKPHVEFYAAEEQKLVERYALRNGDGKIIFEGNSWTISDIALVPDYRREIGKLGALEIEGFDMPVKVPFCPEIKPRQLEALEGFIEFGGE